MREIRLRAWFMPAAGSESLALIERAMEPFYKRYPHVHISWRFVPWNRAWHELTTAFKRRDSPDVFQIGSTWGGTMARLGRLLPPPESIIDRPVAADWIREISLFNGKQFVTPWVCDCSLLVARSDILKRHGLRPEHLSTWDGFLAACQQIGAAADDGLSDSQRPVPIGFSCRPDQGTIHHLSPWWFSGGWRFDDFHHPPVRFLSHPSIQPGIEYLYQLLRTNKAAERYAHMGPFQIRRLFYQEGALAFFCSYWASEVRRVLFGGYGLGYEHRFPVDAMRVPVGPGGSVGHGGASMLGVSSHTAYPEEAWAIVEYMTSDEFFRVWTEATGEPPAHLGEFWEGTAGRTREQIAFVRLMRDALQAAHTFPPHSIWRSVEQAISDGLGLMLLRLLHRGPDDAEVWETAMKTDARVNTFLRFAWEASHG